MNTLHIQAPRNPKNTMLPWRAHSPLVGKPNDTASEAMLSYTLIITIICMYILLCHMQGKVNAVAITVKEARKERAPTEMASACMLLIAFCKETSATGNTASSFMGADMLYFPRCSLDWHATQVVVTIG